MRETIALRERVRQDRAMRGCRAGVSRLDRLEVLLAEMNEAKGLRTGWAERTNRDGERQLFIPGRGWRTIPEEEAPDEPT